MPSADLVDASAATAVPDPLIGRPVDAPAEPVVDPAAERTAQRWGAGPLSFLLLLVAAGAAAWSAWHAQQQWSSDVRSYRTWINGPLPSWENPGPYPVVVNLVWLPLKLVNAASPNPSWVAFWTLPTTVITCLVLWRSTRYWRLAVSTYLLGAALMERSYWLRLDAIPAMLAVISITSARRGRVVLSALVLSVGALIKVWPLFLVPLVLLAVPAAKRIKWLVWFLLPWALFLATVAVLRPPAAMDWLLFTFKRRIQIEAITALPALWAKATGIGTYKIFYAKGLDYADLITGPHLKEFHLFIEVVSALLLSVLAYRMWRWLRSRGWLADTTVRPRVFAAGLVVMTIAIVLIIAAGPVFSPQYMIWFAPMIAIAAGEAAMRKEIVIWWVACFMTTMDYPYHFDMLRKARKQAIAILTVRDLLVLLLLVVLVARFWRTTKPGQVEAGPGDSREPAQHP